MDTLKRCSRCLTPDTRPNTIFKDGVCQACLNYDKRKEVDWTERYREFAWLCAKHRGSDYYDCLIPVSGGKDSYFIAYTMAEIMGMNPLLVTVGDPFTKTEAGRRNLLNLCETFDCDHIQFNTSPNYFRERVREDFETTGHPLKYVEGRIYEIPTELSLTYGISLVMYGENGAYEYGNTDGESPRHTTHGGHEYHFLSYYLPWDGDYNYQIAKRYGFKDLAHEWTREGNIENFDQIDSLGYIVHLWMKYPKFGFARVTDIASRWIRKGKITRKQGMELVRKFDHKLDQRALDDFCNFCGYSIKEFWDIVEKFWNPDIFHKVNGLWEMK